MPTLPEALQLPLMSTIWVPDRPEFPVSPVFTTNVDYGNTHIFNPPFVQGIANPRCSQNYKYGGDSRPCHDYSETRPTDMFDVFPQFGGSSFAFFHRAGENFTRFLRSDSGMAFSKASDSNSVMRSDTVAATFSVPAFMSAFQHESRPRQTRNLILLLNPLK